VSLSAVMGYVKTELDGLASAHYKPASAWIQPPVPGDADPGYPQLFIWTERYKEKRLAAGGNPRGAGLKRSDHAVQVYVLVIDDPSDAHADTAFPNLLNTVMQAFRAVPLPVTITDPDTGATSRISEIGEDFSVQTDAVRALGDERYVRYLAAITVDVFETFNA
jgi:hypothetical protein